MNETQPTSFICFLVIIGVGFILCCVFCMLKPWINEASQKMLVFCKKLHL